MTRTDESILDRTQSHADAVISRVLSAAQPGSVYGVPVATNGFTVITASEIIAAGGFGSGQGSGSGPDPRGAGSSQEVSGDGVGAGGGGFSRGRPVAAIVIGPEGVSIKPILDFTAIGLAAITAVGSMVVLGARMTRRRR